MKLQLPIDHIPPECLGLFQQVADISDMQICITADGITMQKEEHWWALMRCRRIEEKIETRDCSPLFSTLTNGRVHKAA